MRFRTLLSSAAVTAIVIGSAALASPAQAQKGAVLEPQSGWAVTSVENDGGKGGYCAMARRFQDGMVMTVAKNLGRESSVALDFGSADFDTNQSFPVILDPGAGEQRSYDLRPVSKKAFVVRLGKDEKFFDALDRTGFLRAEIAGDSYYFNLADIEEGQQQLNGCLFGMAEPAAGEDVLLPMPGEISSGASTKIAALENENRKLREDNADLIANLNALRDTDVDKAELLRRVSVLEEENRKLTAGGAVVASSDNATAMTSIQSLAAENKRLRAALADRSDIGAGTQFVTGEAAAVFGAHIARLQEENRRLSQIASAQVSCDAAGIAPSAGDESPATAPPQPIAVQPQDPLKEVSAQGLLGAVPYADEAPPRNTDDRPQDDPAEDSVQNYAILRDEKTVKPSEKFATSEPASDEPEEEQGARQPELDQTVSLETTASAVDGSANHVESVLRAAGVAISGPVSIAAQPGAFAGAAVYQWQAGDLTGAAEQRALKNPDEFDSAVREYVQEIKKRCGPGDFAFMPDTSRGVGGTRIDTYDVACVGAGIDISLALLFYSRNGVLTVIAHEARSDQLASAMEIRDALNRTISEEIGFRG